MDKDKETIEKEFYNKFENLVGKTFNIKTKTKTYNGLKLISVDREGSPIRFLNFSNKEGLIPPTLCFAPEEIKSYELGKE